MISLFKVFMSEDVKENINDTLMSGPWVRFVLWARQILEIPKFDSNFGIRVEFRNSTRISAVAC